MLDAQAICLVHLATLENEFVGQICDKEKGEPM